MESVKRELCPAETSTSPQLSDGWKSHELGYGFEAAAALLFLLFSLLKAKQSPGPSEGYSSLHSRKLLHRVIHPSPPDCIRSLCSTDPQGTRMPPSLLCPPNPSAWSGPLSHSLISARDTSPLDDAAKRQWSLSTSSSLALLPWYFIQGLPPGKAYSPLTLAFWSLKSLLCGAGFRPSA